MDYICKKRNDECTRVEVMVENEDFYNTIYSVLSYETHALNSTSDVFLKDYI